MSLFYNVINKFGHIWYLCKGYLWTTSAVWGCIETCRAQCTDIMCTGGEGRGAMARRRARGLLMMKNTKYKMQNAKCNSKTESTRPTYILRGMKNMKFKMHNAKYKKKTLPKALRTQALTALTSNFGLVRLVR